ncbi:MAG: oxidoreductase [Candidatus Aminicenantaceae bacterium]
MSDKPKIAIYWCSSCGGCEEAIVDLNETILDVVDAVDIVFWPVAMDFKYDDVRKLKDGELLASFINGGIRLSEQEEIVKLLRKKSQLVFAFGSCAVMGGVPGLANMTNREGVFKRVYKEIESNDNPENTVPQTEFSLEDKYELELPEFYNSVYPLDQIIQVDYYIPGCAPSPDTIKDAFTAILEGKLPEKGSVLSPTKSLCDTCPRKDSKPDRIELEKFVEPQHYDKLDDGRCFLEAGIICMGPATRGGCGERCINANMPCRGCYGPPNDVKDQGLGMLSALASLIKPNEEKEIPKVIETLPDLIGSLYMYGLPSSILFRKKIE